MHLVLLCGPAFSGKTSLARALEARGALRISLDDMLRERGLEPGAGVPVNAWEDASSAACLLIAAAAQRAQHVVLDDTLCYRFLRDRYRQLGEGAGMHVVLAVLTISASEVRARVAEDLRSPRRRGIDAQLLESHLASFEWPSSDEPHVRLDATHGIEQQLACLKQSVGPTNR